MTKCQNELLLLPLEKGGEKKKYRRREVVLRANATPPRCYHFGAGNRRWRVRFRADLEPLFTLELLRRKISPLSRLSTAR